VRIVHTSDWHVGRTLCGADLLDHQEQVLMALASTVREESVDVVVVAGDIYDRSLPPADAVLLLDRVFAEIRRAGASIVLIPGNHDSAARLSFAASMLATSGMHALCRVEGVGQPVLLQDSHGLVACYGIPYLEPEIARHGLGDPTLRGHEAVLGAAMRRVRSSQAALGDLRSIVLAHCFVRGGTRGDTERDISVGGVEVVPSDVLAGPSYVALGHLHSAQVLAPGMRYSGSPLAYSFSDAGRTRGFWLVDLDATGLRDVHWRELPVPRRLTVLRGHLPDLLADPSCVEHAGDWVCAELTDPVRPLDPMRRLRERFAHCVQLSWAPDVEADDTGQSYQQRVSGRSDLEIAREFVAHVRGEPASDGEVRLLDRALEAGRIAEGAQ
jgi:exonuclease SbcD